MEKQGKKVKKITLGFILGWVLGILAMIAGVVYLFKVPIAGLFYLLLAFVLLPPANKLVKEKLNFSISGGLKFVLVVVLLIIIGMNLGDDDLTISSQSNDSQLSEAQEINIIKVSAKKLYQEYKNNSLAAEQKYGDKQLEVTGSIYDFGTELLGRPYITFGLMETQAIFSNNYASQLAKFEKGQTITILCKISGAPLGYPILDYCKIK